MTGHLIPSHIHWTGTEGMFLIILAIAAAVALSGRKRRQGG